MHFSEIIKRQFGKKMPYIALYFWPYVPSGAWRIDNGCLVF